jgi:para-aminobenzoate synthetase/4-amino-4-deoxychorismate lyase
MLRTIVLRDASAAQWLLFTEPVEVLTASRIEDVSSVFEAVEERVGRDDGLIAAGFVCYEAAPAFDAAFATRAPGRLPLAAFGLYRRREPLATLPFAVDAERGGRLRWQMDTSRDAYRSNIDAIKRQIALGNTYQVNYTVRQRAEGLTNPRQLFRDVAADAPFAAYVDCGDRAIVSASPELFFELNGDHLVCRPMKGTAARGMTTAEDERIREGLRHSTKDRAENVMIADMVRNDVGRVAEAGSVRASSLFDLEKYRTVWQMTSTVEAKTLAPITEIFRALFPSASITGAPKVASMRLIAAIETSPREV